MNPITNSANKSDKLACSFKYTHRSMKADWIQSKKTNQISSITSASSQSFFSSAAISQEMSAF